MFDMHYDLLTILCTVKDKKYLKQIKKNLNRNYKGVCANLFFMSKKEMQDELNINSVNVLKMFKKAKKELKKLKLKTKILYSIEGCDYIKDTKELEKLKKEGLNTIILTWNNPNKYGSGNRSNKGLTLKGREFIKKAIDLNLAIDLSHANEKTFNDIINIIKNSKKETICYVSHSNIYELHNHPRNLKKRQLKLLKSVSGKIGIVAYPDFITNQQNIKESYLNHIIEATKIMGIDNVMLSTDNMDFYYQINNEIPPKIPFNEQKIKKEVKKLLRSYFTKKETKKIMYKNALQIYKKINKTKCN